MSEQKTDQELVEQVQKGNKNAFNLLVIRHQNKVMNIVARYVKSSGCNARGVYKSLQGTPQL
jgi:RNA polymerase sigma-70 factor (ECF subfamily)